MKRAQVLRTALALSAFAAAAPNAARAQRAAASTAAITVGTLPSESAAEAIYGVDGGFFTAVGLDVTTQVMNSGSAIAAAVVAGTLDVGLADTVSIVSAHARGLPFVFLFPGSVSTEAAPEFNLVVRGDSPLRTARDFAGATIAVNALHNAAQLEAQAWIDGNGGSSKNVQFVELPLPAHRPAVEAGRIQATMDTEPFVTYDAAAGMRVIPLRENGIAAAFQVNGWVTTNEWIAAHPTVASRFAEGLRRIAVWANHNHDATAPILASYTKIPLAVVRSMQRYTFAEQPNPQLIQPVIDAAVRYGILAAPFNASAIIASKELS